MKKVGRPKTNIDKSNFEKLCQMQCTLEEIAGFFDCCDDTINNWCKEVYDDNFSVVYKKKSMAGKISLRRNQFKIAENNASMAIFLGKQYLGQKDKIETTGEMRVMPTIKMEVVDNSNLESVLYDNKEH